MVRVLLPADLEDSHHSLAPSPAPILLPASPPPQAIDAVGREVALRRGANVLMPILTPTKYREHYTLYEGEALRGEGWLGLG